MRIKWDHSRGIDKGWVNASGNQNLLITKTQENMGVHTLFKQMTEAEFVVKKAMGLCFRCDGKFTSGHRCPEKAVHVLLVKENCEE